MIHRRLILVVSNRSFSAIFVKVNKVHCVTRKSCIGGVSCVSSYRYSPVHNMSTGDGKAQRIGTHNGSFHCDEALACFLLKQLPQYKNGEIVRTRDQSVLDTCDVVVDVGGKFDPSTHRYDHHQRSFTETMSSLATGKSWVTKLSSAGLVYLHFGRDILAAILELKKDDPVTEIIFDKMYENLIEEIDAIDNGVDQYEGTPRYKITTNLSAQVANLNPAWNEEGVDVEQQFSKAMEMVGKVFLDKVLYYKNSWLPARDLVETAMNDRLKVDESGEIVLFTQGGCPWKDHMFNLEEELAITPPIKYVLFTDQSGKWRIQCVPQSLGSFQNRLSIFKDWWGIRDSELSEKSGIPGCIFVHANGFIGGNETYEGVLAMARYSLKHQKAT